MRGEHILLIRQGCALMLQASRVFSLIKILNSSIFYKILGFCDELESLYGNSYRQLFSVTLFGFFWKTRGRG